MIMVPYGFKQQNERNENDATSDGIFYCRCVCVYFCIGKSQTLKNGQHPRRFK